MFESLKKKFSKTSDKLEEELKEEAEKENNISDEEPQENKRCFCSFGRKKKKEETDEKEEDEDKESKKSFFSFGSKDEESSSDDLDAEKETPDEEESIDDEKKSNLDTIEESEESSDDVEEDKKSRFGFLKRSKDDDESPEESSEDVEEEDVEEEDEEKKSIFSFGRKKKDEDEESSEDVDSEDDEEEEEEKKSIFSFGSKKKNKDDDEESSGGIFSFIREKTISEKHVEDILWELEMGLLEGDVAMEVATNVVESVKNDLVGKKIKRSNDITEYTFNALKDAVADIIDIPGKSMTEMIEEKKALGEPLVVMFVGINGTGKTTTIGKLANYYLKKGYDPVIAASDTFRAGAIEQVTYHADNVGVKIIKHQKGSDPAAVAFDAVEHAKAKGKELVLIDTAGRMQTNTNLMDEMKKIKRVSKPDLVVFVGDALTGNDATEQAVKFNDAIDVDGVILTKADADSKGGASLSIGYVIKKPILFLGMGQGYDDIKEYDADWMLDQLFSEDEEEIAIEE